MILRYSEIVVELRGNQSFLNQALKLKFGLLIVPGFKIGVGCKVDLFRFLSLCLTGDGKEGGSEHDSDECLKVAFH